MAPLFSSRRSRVGLGLTVIAFTVAVTGLRVRALNAPQEALDAVTRLHAQGQASDRVLANAQYHASKAELEHQRRWSPSGYATHAVFGLTLGLALLVARPRRVAA